MVLSSNLYWNTLLEKYPNPEIQTFLYDKDVVYQGENSSAFAVCYSDPVTWNGNVYGNILVYSPFGNKNLLRDCEDFLDKIKMPVAIQCVRYKWNPFFRYSKKYWIKERIEFEANGKKRELLILERLYD